MSDSSFQNIVGKKPARRWPHIIIILAAFVCALWVSFGLRAPVEAGDRTVGLFIDYDELLRVANASLDIEFYDMMRKAHLSGATGLVIRERILIDWEIAGDIIVLAGGQLRLHIEAQSGLPFRGGSEPIIRDGEAGDKSSLEHEIAADGTYILTRDPQVFDQLFSLLYAKRRHPRFFEFQDYMVIATTLHSSERANLGLGFPLKQLEMAAEQGFYIIPRLRNWEPINEVNLAEQMRWVSKIPNLLAVGFNEATVLGGGTNPIIQDRVADALATLNKPLVSFEFFDQVGLGGLAARLDDGFMRVHAIAENEINQYLDMQDAANRYTLAATERNIRFIYVRFQNLINPAASMMDNLELIEFVRADLEDAGLTIGIPRPIPDFSIPFIALLVIGAGVIAAGGWLLSLFAEPLFPKKKLRIPIAVLMILVFFVWVAGLIILPALTRKLFALVAAIIIPSLGIILVLENRDNWQPFKDNLLKSDGSGPCAIKALLRPVVHLIIMSAFTLSGGLIMSALLSEPDFMLKLDTFVGVNVAQIIPLGLVPLVLWVREKNWFGLLDGAVKSNVTVWQFGLSLIMLAAFALLIMRTGNDNPDAVMELELRIRQILHNILGVRPRTSEFLIGHPFMLVLLYFGYKFNMFPLLLAGIVGQTSLMNTYAHIHTPILISLARTGHGLWMGIVLGICMIVVLAWCFKWLRRMQGLENCT